MVGRLTRIGLPALVVAAVLFVQFSDPLFRARIRHNAFDQLQSLHPAAFRDELPVRVVAIDESSLRSIGQWPWSRTVMAQLVEQLAALGAGVVVFDLLFAEPDRTSPEQLAQAIPMPSELRALLGGLPANDAVLAESFGHVPVVLGFPLDVAPALATPAAKARFMAFGGDALDALPPHAGGVPNLTLLEKAAAGNGVISLPPDGDGVVRRMPLLFRVGDALYPGLGLESLRVALGLDNLGVAVASGESGGALEVPGILGVELGTEGFVPTAENGELWLHFRRFDPRRYLSAGDLLAGRVDGRQVEGHIVFIGATAKALGDTVYTPLGEAVPGVEAHLQMVERILEGDVLVSPSWENDFVVAVLLGAWALFAVMLARLRPLWSVLAAALSIGGLFLLSAWLFTGLGLLLDPVFPALAVGLLFTVMVAPRYVETEREQRWIRDAFSRYISPNRVKYLIENPLHLELGGSYRECSFVMSDLAGFTTLMERHEPAMLAGLLNDYLNGMIEIAFRHEGTLDRIVGDAVAVMFSAPVVQPDHAERAVACALEMDRFARRFCADQQAKGVPFGRTRLGVNTGTVLLGNFGGRVILDYRALGDAINTAARLETLNGQIGTHVCVSAATVAQCREFVGRPVAHFVLKGKSEPVEVFEPLTSEEMEQPCIRSYLAAYRQLEANAGEAPEAFARLHEQCPDDPLADFHARRLAAGEQGVRIELTRK